MQHFESETLDLFFAEFLRRQPKSDAIAVVNGMARVLQTTALQSENCEPFGQMENRNGVVFGHVHLIRVEVAQELEERVGLDVWQCHVFHTRVVAEEELFEDLRADG